MSKKGSKNKKNRIEIKGETTGVTSLSIEEQLKEQIEAPMVRLRYACAIDVMQAKLRMMNADLTEDQKAMNWDGSLVRTDWAIPADKEGELTRDRDQLTSRGGYLSLEGTIDVNFYYKTNVSVAAAEILLWDEAAYNAADVLTEANAGRIEDLTWTEGKSRYEYKYEGIAAKEMFSPIYACAKITDTDGNVYYSGVLAYCAERYVSIDQNNADTALATLVRSMAIYGDAARAYFN